MNKLLMGNGVHVPISHVGHSSIDSGNRLLHLKHVLRVPTVCKNLISVAQFARDNQLYFEFHPFCCFVKDIKTAKVLLVGHIYKGLYRFDTSPQQNVTDVGVQSVNTAEIRTCVDQASGPTLWHRKLGHPCTKVLHKVIRECNFVLNKTNLFGVCSPCQLRKSHKLVFSDSKTVYSSPFELVASYLWGLAPLASEGCFYYLTFVDSCARFTWIYLLKTKAEVLGKCVQFHKFVDVQFGSKIKMLQTDWGGEYKPLTMVLS